MHRLLLDWTHAAGRNRRTSPGAAGTCCFLYLTSEGAYGYQRRRCCFRVAYEWPLCAEGRGRETCCFRLRFCSGPHAARRGCGGVGAAVGDVLRRVVPEGAADDQERGHGGGGQGPPHGGLAAQAPLPRLLRPGMRRVGAAGGHGQLHGGAGVVPEQGLAQGVRRRRQHQGAGRGPLPADRLLRRHPRRRRARLHRHPRRASVHRAAGSEGLHHRQPQPGQQRPPSPGLQPRQPHQRLRQEGPQRHRHGCTFRSPHDRAGAVHQLPEPAVRRVQHQRGGRGRAPAHLPAVGGRRQPGADGPGDAQRLRQRLLWRPPLAAWRAPLRPAALQRRCHRRARPDLRVQCRAVPRRLRGGNGAHGRHRGAHREPRRDQGQLLQGELRRRRALTLPGARETFVWWPRAWYRSPLIRLQREAYIHSRILA